MGTVYRQQGRHNWMIKYYRSGRAIVESSGTDDKTIAKKLLRKRETAIDDGLPLGPKVGKIRFEEAATDLINDYRTNGKRTSAHVERRIRLHLEPAFGGRRLATITTADVRAFSAARQAADASNAEINRELAALKRMYTLAMQAGKLLHRPYIPMLAEHNVRTGFFEREQFEAVRRRLPAALQSVVTFAYVTGWRIESEVLSLTWRQVDFQAGLVRLDPGTTKNDEGRVWPFTLIPELKDTLTAQRTTTRALEQRERCIVPWVFHQVGESFLDRSGRAKHVFRETWRTACRAAGCPGRIPHDFRRTAVRNLVRAGVSEKVAMQLTGHKTRSVFDRYDIVNEADLRAAVEKLSAVHVRGKNG